MHFDRRTFLAGGAAGLALPFLDPAWASTALLPGPPLQLNRPALAGPISARHGWRPRRRAGYRMDVSAARINGKRMVNNYGHGGAGITLCWGCAGQVLDLVRQLPEAGGAGPNPRRIAVLGAGVIGLTTATILTENNFDVTVYARELEGNTTSDIAGGQFAPSVLGPGQRDGPNKARLLQAVRNSYSEHLRRSQGPGASYRVHHVDNYTSSNHSDLQDVYEALHPAQLSDAQPEETAFSIGALTMTGYRYKTLLIEVPSMMRWLRSVNRLRNRTFTGPSDLGGLEEEIVVNCLGAGGPGISGDDPSKMDPLLGILAFLPPQNDLDYLFSGAGYIFPRDNELVVGGWVGSNDLEKAEIEAVAGKIVAVMSQLFKGGDIHSLPYCFSGSGKINAIKRPGGGSGDPTDLSAYCPA